MEDFTDEELAPLPEPDEEGSVVVFLAASGSIPLKQGGVQPRSASEPKRVANARLQKITRRKRR